MHKDLQQMRILWLTHEYPEFPSAAHRSWTFLALDELSKRHSIDFVPLQSLPEHSRKFLTERNIEIRSDGLGLADPLPSTISLLKFTRQKFRGLTRKILYPDSIYQWGQKSTMRWSVSLNKIAEDDYDIAVLDHTGFAHLLSFLPTGIPCVLVVANVGKFAFEAKPALPALWTRLWTNYRKRRIEHCDAIALQFADLIICMTEREKQWAMYHVQKKCVVLPVVTNCLYFSEHVEKWIAPAADNWLVFTGTFSHKPNVDAMFWFCKSILPLVRMQCPRTGIVIVGMDPPPEIIALSRNDQLIVVTQRVPDVRPYMAAGAVYVAPLRFGAGIKIKVMEAMAMGQAVVATSAACEGLGVTHGEQLLIANEPKSFADQILRLFQDKILSDQLKRCAAEFARANFCHKKQVKLLEDLLRQGVLEK